MADATRFQFNDPSVPKAYDEFLVPRLFEPWAKLLLDEAGLQPGESVLDIATGPGTVARLAAARLGARGRIVATDISEPMLDIAKRKSQPSTSAPIEYLQSPATPLAAAPSGAALKTAAEDAGFRQVRLVTRSLPMVLEGGVEQAVRAFAATPTSPGVAALAQHIQDAFFAQLREEMSRLLKDGKVVGEMTSNIIVGNC
jgi:SAM-dependent methyltransferase